MSPRLTKPAPRSCPDDEGDDIFTLMADLGATMDPDAGLPPPTPNAPAAKAPARNPGVPPTPVSPPQSVTQALRHQLRQWFSFTERQVKQPGPKHWYKIDDKDASDSSAVPWYIQ